jgi:hypothetical protein
MLAGRATPLRQLSAENQPLLRQKHAFPYGISFAFFTIVFL